MAAPRHHPHQTDRDPHQAAPLRPHQTHRLEPPLLIDQQPGPPPLKDAIAPPTPTPDPAMTSPTPRHLSLFYGQNPEDSRSRKLNRFHWWLLVICNVIFLIAGQTSGVLLGRFYYDKGGSSTFMATLVQTAAFPILLIPLLLLPSQEPPTPSNPPKKMYICAIYVVLGILIAGDNLLYSVGLLYLSASTYSLISGQWRSIGDEMVGFRTGKASYVMTLAWTAVCWQVGSVGVVGLIFLVSSLFSNVISTVALAVAPIAAVIVFHDKMNGVKIIAMIQAFWGLGSYTYQEYLDESAKDGSQDARRSSLDV